MRTTVLLKVQHDFGVVYFCVGSAQMGASRKGQEWGKAAPTTTTVASWVRSEKVAKAKGSQAG